MKINILQIITKLELGGAQQHVLYYAEHLNREKYNVFLVSGTEGVLTEDALKLQETTVKLMKCLKHEISPLKDIVCLFKLIAFMRKNKIDIVHTHSSKAGVLGRLAAFFAGVPVVIHTVHGFSFNDFQNPLKKNIYIFLERLAAKVTDKLTVVTKLDIEKGLKAKVGAPGKYIVIRSGINTREFKVPFDVFGIKKEMGIKESGPVIGMIACFKPQKNPLDFIRAAELISREVPDAMFVVAGDGELRVKIEQLAEELKIKDKVLLLGWRRDIAFVMASFDVLVLTSLYEGLPRVLLQAMAAGKPVVANAVDGVSEVIKDGVNGFLCEPRDVKGLAGKIIKIIRDPALGKKLGGAGLKMTDEYSEEKMLSDTEKLYDTLAEKINEQVQ